MTDDSGHILGVFNYCDRWCERCPFISRCGSYALGEELEAEIKEREAQNRRFWEKLGIDSDLGIPEPASGDECELDLPVHEPSFEEELQESSIENHPCVLMAQNYMQTTRAWLKENDLLSEKDSQLEEVQRNAPESRDIIGFDDAVTIVTWYHLFIYMKTQRAVSGLYDDHETDFDMPRDSDGSAKIALIAMDRSIAALQIIGKEKPEWNAETREFISRLVGLRRRTEETFPCARDFKRPGFDDSSPIGK